MIFMETMGNLRRTHYCGTLRARDAGTQMTVAGSIAKCLDKGGVIFADLRDTTGILQLIFDDSKDRAVFEKASGLKSEYVVIAAGTLREREAKTDKIPTGEVELFVTELRVLSGAQTTPFEVRDGINVNDQLRLKYRYLDLRRPSPSWCAPKLPRWCGIITTSSILWRSRLLCSSNPRPRARGIIWCPAVCSRGISTRCPSRPSFTSRF